MRQCLICYAVFLIPESVRKNDHAKIDVARNQSPAIYFIRFKTHYIMIPNFYFLEFWYPSSSGSGYI